MYLLLIIIYLACTDYLSIYPGLTESGPRCSAPAHLKSRPIHKLANHEFRCTGKLFRVGVNLLVNPLETNNYAIILSIK